MRGTSGEWVILDRAAKGISLGLPKEDKELSCQENLEKTLLLKVGSQTSSISISWELVR